MRPPLGRLTPALVSLAVAAALSACTPDNPQTTPPQAAAPCPDFWTGAWTASVPPGGTLPGGAQATTPVKAADASFRPLFVDPGSCTYLERWDTVPMSDGKSRRGVGVHHYDRKARTWSQLWIDNAGAESTSAGQEFERGVRYTPTVAPADGAQRRQIIVPLPGGNVRNYGEASRDGGKTWQVEFDFIYTRN